MGMSDWPWIVDVSSFNARQSVNGHTPGDYKLQNLVEQTISDRHCVVASCI